MSKRPLRYISHNRFQEFPASYHSTFGTKAYDWAVQNARWHQGEVVCEYTDGSTEVVWPPVSAGITYSKVVRSQAVQSSEKSV